MECPKCHTESFYNHEYEAVTINSCKSCKGVWLSSEALCQIIENRTVKFRPEDIRHTVARSFTGLPPAEASDEKRLCPACRDKLSVVNYDYNSGIIIDLCPHGHGIWLDAGELESIQKYREYWIDEIKVNEQSLTKMIEDVDAAPTEAKFKSLFFSLSIELSEILQKFKS